MKIGKAKWPRFLQFHRGCRGWGHYWEELDGLEMFGKILFVAHALLKDDSIQVLDDHDGTQEQVSRSRFGRQESVWFDDDEKFQKEFFKFWNHHFDLRTLRSTPLNLFICLSIKNSLRARWEISTKACFLFFENSWWIAIRLYNTEDLQVPLQYPNTIITNCSGPTKFVRYSQGLF